MARRPHISAETQTDVLLKSKRRCCLCYGLEGDLTVKQGQIAHLDGDPSNNDPRNLAFLCLNHHDAFDSRTSQSKGITLDEVLRYRDDLYAIAPWSRMPTESELAVSNEKELPFVRRESLLLSAATEVVEDSHPPITVSALARRLGLTHANAERILIQLAKDGVVRMDRSRGSMKLRFSAKKAFENRVIDRFLLDLGESVVSDERFVRTHQGQVDAVIRTPSRQYAVLTVPLHQTTTESRIDRWATDLRVAKENPALQNCLGVLLLAAPTQDEIPAVLSDGSQIEGIEVITLVLSPSPGST